MEILIFGVLAIGFVWGVTSWVNGMSNQVQTKLDARSRYEPPQIRRDGCPAGSCSTSYHVESESEIQARIDRGQDARRAYEAEQIALRSGTWSKPLNPGSDVYISLPGENQEIPLLTRGNDPDGEWVQIGDHSWTRPEYVERGRR